MIFMYISKKYAYFTVYLIPISHVTLEKCPDIVNLRK